MSNDLDPIAIQECPKCSEKLPPRLSSGRIVCRKCGWADKAKAQPGRPLQLTFQPPSFFKTKDGERALIGATGFVAATLLWLGSNALKPESPASEANAQPHAPTETAKSNPISPAKAQLANSFTLAGTFTLIDSDLNEYEGTCTGSGGYRDISFNMPVTVRDGAGKILAIGRTGSGTLKNSVSCVFNLKVENVPKADFYTIEIGRRGGINYSFEDMQRQNWQVSLSLS